MDIRIRLIGNVAYEYPVRLSADFRTDVLTDGLGIPILPLPELLPEEILSRPGLRVGIGLPDGYAGLVRAADFLAEQMDAEAHVRACFTEERPDPETGDWCRFLKAGLTFYASVYLEQESEEAWEDLRRALKRVTRLGIRREGVTGEVECDLEKSEKRRIDWKQPPALLRCDRLEYMLMPITPLCLDAPYGEDVTTLTWVPGGVLREDLRRNLPAALAEKLDRMIFTNAYVSDGLRRLLPLPLCMSLVKLDKTQLHYRLASGKDPGRTEQDVGVGDAYAEGFEDRLIRYTKPETEKVVSLDGALHDALRPGQMFRGEIRGEDADLRALADWMSGNPILRLGDLKRESFGETCLAVGGLRGESIETETLARAFDVSCLSPAILIGASGVPEPGEALFLAEIERLLGAPGALRIVEKYLDVYRDYGPNPRWKDDSPVTGCLARGSVMRLETADGKPIDLTPILHAFIGERNEDGYGEIMAYAARGCYYRSAEYVPSARYDLDFPLFVREIDLGAEMVRNLFRDMLKRNVQMLAATDRIDPGRAGEEDSPIPWEILRMIRERFDRTLPDETLEKWYREAANPRD
ncbi:MAG: hypothetical protein IJI21_10750 [Clostridia bacterium]|nr:hypothetical protein [Clostridia bacterium]